MIIPIALTPEERAWIVIWQRPERPPAATPEEDALAARIAEAVRVAEGVEREECAAICDKHGMRSWAPPGSGTGYADDCADEIRARGAP